MCTIYIYICIYFRQKAHHSQIIPLLNSRLKIYKYLSIERCRPSLVVDIFSDFFPLFNLKIVCCVYTVWMRICLWLWRFCLYHSHSIQACACVWMCEQPIHIHIHISTHSFFFLLFLVITVYFGKWYGNDDKKKCFRSNVELGGSLACAIYIYI